jgi:SAM-dependent methyltransferase
VSDDAIPKTLTAIRDLYTSNLAAHGATSKSVGWRDEASQLLRFDRLSQVIEPAARRDGFTAADWGCGYGAMYHYLDRTAGGALRAYTGYDISEPMLETARRAITAPRARFVLAAEVEQDADYAFVSGTFNVRMKATREEWDAYIRQQLQALWARSRRGLAFNLLTSYVDWEQPDLFYADPREFFDFCRRHLSRYVTLLHDYPLYEWTMIVRREGTA